MAAAAHGRVKRSSRIATVTLCVAALGLPGCASRPTAPTPQVTPPAPDTAAVAPVGPNLAPPAFDAIREDQIGRDLFALAGDALRGREAGTVDELGAAAWIAEQARAMGLEPAGDHGTYWQFFPLRRLRLSDASRIAIGGYRLELWRDLAVMAPVESELRESLVFVGDTPAERLDTAAVRGRAVAAFLLPPRNPPPAGMSLRGWRHTLAALRERSQALIGLGAIAVVLVGDSISETEFVRAATGFARGRYGLDTTGTAERPSGPPVIWVRRNRLELVRAQRAALETRLVTESFIYPSANVVARARGTDSVLGTEHVLFSAHHDHDGARYPVDGDSIWNGADDNASVSVAVLAIGRALARAPGKRSALFVWHGAEERGLLGSRWFVRRPTVPRESIVAVLNGDMVGRNHPDTAALLGAQPPHRNSEDLVTMALEANARFSRFALDTTWDRPSHPEFWYFRSDHLPYARAGIPAIYFSTLLHPDYHTPRDEPARIDLAKLARVARWMYATGWAVANAPSRPKVDSGFQLER